MEKKFKIDNISETQLGVIKEALEFYSRFCLGQTEYLPTTIDLKDGIDYEKKRKILLDLKGVIFPELMSNSSYGVGNYRNLKGTNGGHKFYGQVGYEIMKDIKKYIYDNDKNQENDYYSVDSEGPLRYSGEGGILVSESDTSLNQGLKLNNKKRNDGLPF